MARSLTSQQISMLQSAFFTPAQIQAYESGQPNAAADRVIAHGGSFLGQPAPSSSAAPADKYPALTAALNNGSITNALQGTRFNPSNIHVNQSPSTYVPGGPGGKNLGTGNYVPGGPNAGGKGYHPAGGSVSASGSSYVPGGPNAGGPGYHPETPPPAPDPMADYPIYPTNGGGSYAVPTITPKDFTAEAMALATKAFQPVQDMLDQSKTNVGAQGDRNRQIVGGLYDNLVKDIATHAAAQSQQYDAQKATTQNNGNALAAQIGQNYSTGNQQTADLLGKLGIQAAAPAVLQQSSNDQAFQQGQANTNTANEVNYFGQQQQGQADYNTQLGNIQQNEGVNRQKDVLNQVQQLLAGIDAQKAQAASNTSTTGLDLANKLSAQDLSAQQANAGFAQTANQNAQQSALDQYKAATAQWDAGNSAKAAQSAAERQNALDQAQLAQQQFDNNLKTNSYNLDVAKAQTALAGGSAVTNPVPGKNLPESRAAYVAQDPTNGGVLFDAIMKLAQDPAYLNATASAGQGIGQFLQAARQLAVSAGKPEDQAAIIAADIYTQLHGNG